MREPGEHTSYLSPRSWVLFGFTAFYALAWTAAGASGETGVWVLMTFFAFLSIPVLIAAQIAGYSAFAERAFTWKSWSLAILVAISTVCVVLSLLSDIG